MFSDLLNYLKYDLWPMVVDRWRRARIPGYKNRQERLTERRNLLISEMFSQLTPSDFADMRDL